MKNKLYLIAIGIIFFIPSAAHATTIYLTSGSSWTVPSDWSNSGAVIEVIGGGGGGGGEGGSYYGAGGGGGAYARRTSGVSLSPGQVVSYQIGGGGAGGVLYGQVPGNGGDTWFVSPSFVLARGGTNGGTTPYGGQAGASVGDVMYSGGDGGGPTHNEDYSDVAGGGGGGAAGPNGNGISAQNGLAGYLNYPWYGQPGSGDAGYGGAAGSSLGGPTCGTPYQNSTCGYALGGLGGNGAEWGSYGSGGGGGGSNSPWDGGATGGGGYYGGGGGGGSYNDNGYGNSGGNGAPGIIRITYNSDPCPTPIESYWGAGNYLFWSTATRRINAAGVNVCATNNAGAHYFVPGRTYGELQSFINAAGRLGVSIF